MSCIVAHGPQGWMVADMRLTGEHEICLCEVKKIIKVADHSLIGVVGQFGILEMLEQVIVDASSDPSTLVKSIAEWFRDKFLQTNKTDAEVTVVDIKGKLTVIAECGGLMNPTHPFYASGSGRMAAHGYMKGVDSIRPLTMNDAGAAIRVASTMETGVGDKLYGLSLFGHTLSI